MAPTTVPATTTTTSRYQWTPEQQAVVDTYLAWDRAFHEAAQMEKPDFTDMAKYGGGDLLQANRVMLTAYKSDGIRERPGANQRAQVVPFRYAERNGKSYLDICEVDDHVIYRLTDGSVIDDDIVTRLRGAQIESLNGQLKVTGGQQAKEWPGEALEACLNS